ncbi:unnamed protein product [Pleuronectes platessa]|uniref:Uncharacterized protein n=1 Tax=Pleuronectes platessa TaxID=8262 RepID=A0A9N7VQG8_PLEPL|nr:unnamed protein product [Pleuronectes platessa]
MARRLVIYYPKDQPQVDITFGAASYEDLPQVDITFGAASYEDLPQVELTSKPAPLVLGEKRKMFRWPRDTEPVVFLEASCSSKKPWNPADQKDQKRRRIPSKPVVFLGAASYEDQPQVDITFGAASYEDLPQVDITFGAASYEDLPQASCSSKKPWNPADQKDQKRRRHSIQPWSFSALPPTRISRRWTSPLALPSYEDLPQVDITFGAASYEDLPQASCSSKKPWNPADQKDQKRRRIPSKPVVFLGAASYEDQPQVDITFGAASYEDLPQVDITFGAASYEDLPQASCSSKKPWNPADQKDQKRRRIPSKPVVFLGAASYEDQPQVDITFGAASYEDLPQVDITFGGCLLRGSAAGGINFKPAPLVLGEKRKMFRWPRDTEPVVFLEASCSSKKPWNLG